ncbi:MFS transporter [Streptomyces albiflavescens]|uniref:MFS transporter n=1 Tax=Streptomyces albiflavescens TaxID=1623582 RepID=A0A918D3C3_9ACTN|nr:MFS transporter [Streptomyces albiflavescens]GGN62248.1 MFS transporter [Streptomyces albiflavescens]
MNVGKSAALETRGRRHTTQHHRSHRPWHFRTVVGVVFVVMAASSAPSPLYGLYQQQWHFGTATSTIIYACYALGAVLTLLLAGGLAEHLGTQRTIVVALATIVVSFLAFLLATGAWALCLARLIQGVAVGLLTSSAGSALADLHRDRSHRAAAASNSAATSTGIALGAVFSGLAVQFAPAPLVTPFVVLTVLSLGGLALVRAIPAWQIVPERLRPWRPRGLRMGAEPRGILLRVAPMVIAGWAVVGMYLALGVDLVAGLLHTSDRAMSSLVILVVQGCGGIAPMLLRRLGDRAASVTGCALLVAGVGVSVVGFDTAHALLFFSGAAITGAGFGLSFMGSTSTVTAAVIAGGHPQLLPGFFALAYLAVSVPVVALGAAASRFGVAAAFSGFGLLVALLAMVAGASAVRRGRPASQPGRAVAGHREQ